MQTAANKDEISLKELMLTLRGWKHYFLSKWIIIVVCGLIGAGLGVTYALIKKVSYVGELTFVLEDSKSSGALGLYAGLASQFGLDLGGGSGSGVFSGDNILEFLKSRLMVEKALLSPVKIDSRTTTLADEYITVYEMRKSWEKNAQLKDLRFLPGQQRKSFSRSQDSVLFVLFQSILKNNLAITKPDKKLSFISVQCTSPNEIFSKAFTERLVKEATTFYIETRIKRSKTNVDLLQAKADSLETLLNNKTYSVAKAQDLNLNPARQLATVTTELDKRDKMVLQTMYGEVIKNLELSRMSMAQETPLIQVVDSPILPLKKERFGKLKGLIVGGFLGGFLIICFLTVKRISRQALGDA